MSPPSPPSVAPASLASPEGSPLHEAASAATHTIVNLFAKFFICCSCRPLRKSIPQSGAAGRSVLALTPRLAAGLPRGLVPDSRNLAARLILSGGGRRAP